MSDTQHPFDDTYFKRAAYSNVSFERYSQYWWSNRFYAHLARKHGPPSGRVLEVGCGLGHLLGWLTDKYRVFGADINSWALAESRRNVPQGNFVLLSAEELDAFKDSAFQIVIAKHVVEHLHDPERAVAEMGRVLAPGGLLVLATPNLSSPMRGVKKDLWIGYQDPTHINMLPPEQWIEYLHHNDLEPKRVFSDGFWDAPYVSWLPTKFQKILFGAPGGLQAILGWSIIPLTLGESMIVLADKK